MRVHINGKKGNQFQFSIADTTTAFANALRRGIVNETPTMAIHRVEFRKNSSTLYDEMVAHRLGLIPLKTDLKSYRLPQSPEEIEEGSPSCTVKLICTV